VADSFVRMLRNMIVFSVECACLSVPGMLPEWFLGMVLLARH